MQRCEGCGKPQKAAKPKKDPLEQRLAQLQKEQESLEAKLTACLMEQAAITKKLESK